MMMTLMMILVMVVVLQETESNLEMERSAAQEARESSTILERKFIASQTELDDVRSLLEAVSTQPIALHVICGLYSVSHRYNKMDRMQQSHEYKQNLVVVLILN